MADLSAEQFAQRVFDVNLLDARQLESVWSELGTRELTLQDFTSYLLRKEKLTNFQIDRLLAGKRTGYFYGDYKVLYMVGAGTFARVYRAVHTTTGKVAAVKVLRQRYSEDAGKTEQFFREAQLVTKLRHVNIVPIFEVHSEQKFHYMIMDFVEGQNLRDFVKAREKLTVTDALSLITDIVAGLEYAISFGITHRDLKLSNVLVSSSGRAKIVDFGLAAITGEVNDKNAANNPNPRSIDYAGLERITGVRKDDQRSDIYFAGCMFYHMLTGVPPLAETKDRIQRLSTSRFQDVKPITDYEPELPLPVVVVVNKAMELKVERRYATPGEMHADLKRAAKRIEEGDTAPATSPEAVKQAAAALAALASDDMEGQSKTVMVIESNVELQDLLRERLKRHGYRALVTSDPERALQRFENDTVLPDCVVFGTGELGRAALDAFEQFATNDKTKNQPAILLVDQGQRAVAQRSKLAKHRVIVTMPLKFKEFRAVLKQLIADAAQPAGK